MFQGFVRERLSHTRELHDKFAFAYALVPSPLRRYSRATRSSIGRWTIWENGTNERRALVDGETGGAKPPV